jgi:SAM-dependent methyltransferase
VTGIDVAPRLLATARRAAAAEGLRIRFDLGAAEALPYPDSSFDVVTSAQGVIFASDPAAAAHELARVCVAGGRMALTALVPEGPTLELDRLLAARRAPGPGPLDWGRPAYVEALLGASFRLRFERGNAPIRAPSAQAVWELYARCYGPLKALVDVLPARDRAALRRRLIAVYERHQTAAGVCIPRPFLLAVGIRDAYDHH